jgi:twitching motility protein PilT
LAAPGIAAIPISLDAVSPDADTSDLLGAVLRAHARVSDVIFSPGRTLQVQINGALINLEAPGLSPLTADDTRRIASQLIGNNKAAIGMLREQGYCDVSYALPGVARFRVNVFIQRGSCAVVLRVIPTAIPTLKGLGAPDEFEKFLALGPGLVLVTGPRSSGKSSTLAALVNHINESVPCHIITIEDPIEFLHNHKRATVHQREVHSDTPSMAQAVRAALRQAPNIIVIGELKDRETTELALEAAETGHLVLSTLNTLNAPKAVERLLGSFANGEQASIRERLARMLRSIVCQRLIPRTRDGERVAVFEIVPPDAVLRGEEKPVPGVPTLDEEIERLVRAGVITSETALAHALDPASLARALAPSAPGRGKTTSA